MSDVYAGQGVRITLHFELRLKSGEVIDSTFGKTPGAFNFGDGTLPEGIEALVRGMLEGERKQFEVSPEQAFGLPNPNNVQRFKRSEFNDIENLQTGIMISFADASQSELAGVVSQIDGDFVEVDFNHPLAGRQLLFTAEIIKLERLDNSGQEVVHAN